MNEFDDIDRELDTAFSERPSVLSRPSLRDVKRRARRHQRQRSAGVLGACAIVGVGGAAVLATHSPANQTTLGEGEAAASTICFPTESTFGYYDSSTAAPLNTLPVTTYATAQFYVVQEGDTPASVASSFVIGLELLNAANISTPGYDAFYVGLEIRIPEVEITGTTVLEGGIAIAGEYTLQQGDFPSKVAEMFHITVAQLDAANLDVNGYGGFIVGTKIYIPEASQFADTTTTNVVYPDVPDTTFDTVEPTAYTTSIMSTTTSLGDIQTVYLLEQGDSPEGVASAFGVSVAQLDVANFFTAGYVEWLAGTAIIIPLTNAPETTAPFYTGPTDTNVVAEVVACFPTVVPTTGFPSEDTTLTTIVEMATTVPPATEGTAIQVLNCSNQDGVARNMTNALAGVGFATVEADYGTIDIPMTKVIYNPDDPPALSVALSVAALLGNAEVEASGPVVPSLTLGRWAVGSSVIVLLGDDLAGKTLAQIAAGTAESTIPASTVETT